MECPNSRWTQSYPLWLRAWWQSSLQPWKKILNNIWKEESFKMRSNPEYFLTSKFLCSWKIKVFKASSCSWALIGPLEFSLEWFLPPSLSIKATMLIILLRLLQRKIKSSISSCLGPEWSSPDLDSIVTTWQGPMRSSPCPPTPFLGPMRSSPRPPPSRKGPEWSSPCDWLTNNDSLDLLTFSKLLMTNLKWL